MVDQRQTRGADGERSTRRRTVLTGFGGAVMTALAGCLGSDDTSDDGPTEPESDEQDGEADDDGESPDDQETAATDDTESESGDADEGDDTEGQEWADVEFVHPETVTIDEQFSVELENVPAETVDIEASLQDFQGTRWSTRATYEVTDGTLDLDSAEPRDAAFDDPGTMNLVQWTSAETVGGYFPHWVEGDQVIVDVVSGDETVASTAVDRTFGDLERYETDSDEFVGGVIEPPGDDPVPGVILLHGSGGQPPGGVAQLLAASGFVTLPIQYFDWEGQQDLLPRTLVEVPLEFVEAAADWLLDHDRVTGSQVGAWGISKGGELALLSGSRFDTIGPVVSVNGSGYVWEGVGDTITVGSSWSYDDEPIDYVPYADHENWYEAAPRELEPAYSASLEDASEEELAEATIPVEEIDGPVTLVTGGDDKLWNSLDLHTVVTDRLDEHGEEYTHLVYEGAGHAIRHPYLPATNREANQQFVNGGTTAGYAEADVDHWPQVIETFDTLREE